MRSAGECVPGTTLDSCVYSFKWLVHGLWPPWTAHSAFAILDAPPLTSYPAPASTGQPTINAILSRTSGPSSMLADNTSNDMVARSTPSGSSSASWWWSGGSGRGRGRERVWEAFKWAEGVVGRVWKGMQGVIQAVRAYVRRCRSL